MTKQINREEIMREVFSNMEIEANIFPNDRRMKSHFILNGEKNEVNIICDNSFDDLLQKVNNEIDEILKHEIAQETLKETFEVNTQNYNADWICAEEKGIITIEDRELFQYVMKQIRKYKESEDFKNYVINTLGIDNDYRTYNSLLVEDYFGCMAGYSDNTRNKIIDFLKKYMFKGLYAVEGIKYGMLFILIEDDEDNVLDKLYISEINESEYQATHRKESIDDYKLLDGVMSIDAYLRHCAEGRIKVDKFDVCIEVAKYLGSNGFVCDAIDYDEDESTILLILDKDKNVLDKIYY